VPGAEEGQVRTEVIKLFRCYDKGGLGALPFSLGIATFRAAAIVLQLKALFIQKKVP
jgi:hypothetical protein